MMSVRPYSRDQTSVFSGEKGERQGQLQGCGDDYPGSGPIGCGEKPCVATALRPYRACLVTGHIDLGF